MLPRVRRYLFPEQWFIKKPTQSWFFLVREPQRQISEQLLTTKLYIPPTRPVYALRPRLIERLDGGLHRKLPPE